MRKRFISNQSGFSLLEIAIVLTISGLVVSGIWLAIVNVNDSARNSKLVGQATEIMANARRTFGKAAELPNVSSTTAFTAASVQAGIFPADMVQSNSDGGFNVINALGTNTYLAYSASSTPEFNLTFAGITKKSCISLYTRIMSSAASRQQYGVTGYIVGRKKAKFNNNQDLAVAAVADYCLALQDDVERSSRNRAPDNQNVSIIFTIL